jgi:hypothetical protein
METLLYNDTIKLIFNPTNNRKRYQVSFLKAGEWSPLEVVPGVTGILSTLAKPELMGWAATEAAKSTVEFLKQNPHSYTEAIEHGRKAYVRKSDAGKDTGTMVHDAIELYLRHQTTTENLPEEAEYAFNAWLQWWQGVGFDITSVERVVYSINNNYAGKFDAILRGEQGLVMVDWKTTKQTKFAPRGVYPEYLLQLGAYSRALREEGIEISDALIGSCGKNGVFIPTYASEYGYSIEQLERLFCETSLPELTRELKFMKIKTEGLK